MATNGEKPRFERRLARDDAERISPVRFRETEVIPPGMVGHEDALEAVRRMFGTGSWTIEARYGLVSTTNDSRVPLVTSEESGVVQNRPVWLVTLTGHDIPSFGGDNLESRDELNIVLDAATGRYLFAYAFPDPDADLIRPFTPWITVQGRHRWKVRAAFDAGPQHP